MQSDTDTLCYASATELAERIRNGDLSPVAVVDALLDQIETHDGSINAFVHVLAADARAAARDAEKAVENDEDLGPLHGVPVAIKDLDTPVEGVPSTCGSVPLADAVAQEDATIVTRLRDAGAIVLGTTNTPEFGHKGTTDNPLHGTTVTPFDADRISGGSSGGSAAAVAAGMVPIASGSDAGGSIRIPSSACGTFGLMPTYGLIPFDSRPDALESHTPFTCHGPITRTVADAAVALDVMAGWHPRDPLSVADYETDYLGATDRGIDDRTVGYTPDLGVFPVADRVRTAFEDAVDVFETAGATVRPLEVDHGFTHEELHDGWEKGFLLLMASLPDKVERETGIDLVADHREELTPEFLEYIEAGAELTIDEFKRADMVRTAFFDAVQDCLEEVDLLATPTLGVLPFDAGKLGPTAVGDREVDPLFGWQLTWPFNLTGHPVASFPADLVDGLPVGLQVVGQRFDDETVLAASAAFERERPWGEYYPPAEVA